MSPKCDQFSSGIIPVYRPDVVRQVHPEGGRAKIQLGAGVFSWFPTIMSIVRLARRCSVRLHTCIVQNDKITATAS